MRNRLLLAAALTVASVLAPAGAANSMVVKSDLLSHARVAKLYPHLVDGSRYTNRSPGLFLVGADCATDKLHRAKGWYAGYDPKRPMAVTAAKPYVYLHVWDFATVKRAKKAVAAARDLPQRCPLVDAPSGATEVTAYDVPAVGQEGTGYRMHTPSEKGWATIGLARSGARVVHVGVVSSRNGFGADRPIRKLIKAAAARAL
ncbi:hypothetical protein [Nocardioides daejeonensis]|uniref:hypothetical protein n=1 Tax=Nocardioides daejeonensis TaxID=1046556 RepID=UPI000D74F71E|nr:hypothetical protein [Nocardioides daejeonensis]